MPTNTLQQATTKEVEFATHLKHPDRILKVIRRTSDHRLALCEIDHGGPRHNWRGHLVWLPSSELTPHLPFFDKTKGQGDLL